MKKLDTMRFIVGRFTSFSTEIESFPKIFLYSMKIKVQTRKTDEVSSKHGFEVVDETDEVSSKHGFEVADRTDEVSNIYTVRRR
ncbi:N-ethylammeline chlorohydrolase [Streptococcus pneumoniae]|nr:N-ethylammeline chlorohydrolase [Streptococcus pneumoniae]